MKDLTLENISESVAENAILIKKEGLIACFLYRTHVVRLKCLSVKQRLYGLQTNNKVFVFTYPNILTELPRVFKELHDEVKKPHPLVYKYINNSPELGKHVDITA